MFRVTETIMGNVTQNPNSNPYPKPSNQTVENGRCGCPESAPERMGDREIDSAAAPYLTRLCPTYDFHARIEGRSDQSINQWQCLPVNMSILFIYLFIMSYLPRSTPSVRSTVLPGAPALHA